MEAHPIHELTIEEDSDRDWFLSTNAISPDGTLMAFGYDTRICIWKIKSPSSFELIYDIPVDFMTFTDLLQWTPNNRYLVISTINAACISFFDIVHGVMKTKHFYYNEYATISPDGRLLITEGSYRKFLMDPFKRLLTMEMTDLRRWVLIQKKQCSSTIRRRNYGTRQMDKMKTISLWSPDMKYLASLHNFKVFIYSAHKITSRYQFKLMQKLTTYDIFDIRIHGFYCNYGNDEVYINDMKWSPSSRYLAFHVVSKNHLRQDSVMIWDVKRNVRRCHKKIFDDDSDETRVISDISWSPDDKYLAITTLVSDVYIWALDDDIISIKTIKDRFLNFTHWSPCGYYLYLTNTELIQRMTVIRVREEPHVRSAKLVTLDRATQLCLPTELLGIVDGFLN